MILLNSFAFELLMLCLFYSAPDERDEGDPLVSINIVGVIISSVYASIITLPVMVSFAWLFDPIIFVRVGIWILCEGMPWRVRAFFLWPCWLGHCCYHACKRSPHAAADRAFRTIDTKRKGTIKVEDAAEYMASSSSRRCESMPQSKARATIIALDKDGDGNISLDDWREGWGKGMLGSAVSPPPSPPAPRYGRSASHRALPNRTQIAPTPIDLGSMKSKPISITERHLGLLGNRDSTDEPQGIAAQRGAQRERNFSYASLDSVLLAASLTRSWSRRDWPAVRKIMFGWTTNILLFYGMLFGFLLYGCELFEPREHSETTKLTAGGGRRRVPGSSGGSGRGVSSSSDLLSDTLALNGTVVNATTVALQALGGSTTDFLYAWCFSALQRFVLHEPTLILAAKGLPILFASAFCANCVGETVVNILTVTFESVLTCIMELTKA